jgi:hypothetical protein
VRIPLLFAFEKLEGNFSGNKELPGGSDKLSLQMKSIVPKPSQKATHANTAIGVLLTTMGTIFCLVRQWMIAISAVPFHDFKYSDPR